MPKYITGKTLLETYQLEKYELFELVAHLRRFPTSCGLLPGSSGVGFAANGKPKLARIYVKHGIRANRKN